MNDFLVKRGIESFLAKHTFYNFSNVKVFFQKGVVLLIGKVLNAKEKNYVESSVERLPGVKKVITKLEISTEAATAKLPSLKSVVGV